MLKLKIISPEKVVFNGAVDCVIVPGLLGKFEILDNHAPIISALDKGQVEYQPTGGERATFDIAGGFVEVLKNQVNLCIET